MFCISGASDDQRELFISDRRASHFVRLSSIVKTWACHPGPVFSLEASRAVHFVRCPTSHLQQISTSTSENLETPSWPESPRRRLRSRIPRVHVSVGPSVPHTGSAETNEDDAGGAESNPEEVITNAHGALPTDGLLSSSELTELFAVPTHPRILYDEGQRLLDTTSDLILRCGERLGPPPHRRGAYEPEWTSYTHYWQSEL